jgi:hypothetical protein
MKGKVTEYGTKKKEKKDETEITHLLKVKGEDFNLSVASWDKPLMEETKTNGEFKVDTGIAEIRLELKVIVRKEKYDKEDENVMPCTGNPWFTFKKTFIIQSDAEIEDAMTEIKKLIENGSEVEFV